MTQRAVWIFCLFIVLLSLLSVVYQFLTPDHFDSTQWKSAEERNAFQDRRGMMSDLNKMFASGEISSRENAQRVLGTPERTSDADANVWFYNLGGQHSAVGPDALTWLELKFNDAGSLMGHRVTQELIVPPRGAEIESRGSKIEDRR